MRFRTKLVIFLVASLLTFLGFNMIASTSVDILKVGKEAGYEIIANFLSKSAPSIQHSKAIKG